LPVANLLRVDVRRESEEIMATVWMNWDEPAPETCRRGVVTIGNFDGVHRGHQALLAELVGQARTLGGPAVVLTFDPHPLQLLRPAQFQPLLTTVADRAELLQAHGADHVVVLRTSPALLRLSAEEFFDQVVRHHLEARALVEGENFRFGRERQGSVATLSRLCGAAGLGFRVASPVQRHGVLVSSSRVRAALLAGDVAEAAELLGRPFRIRGRVVSGQRRGQTLGFPTANLEQVPTLVPGDGVYAVRVRQADALWPGAANVGPNPTFGEHARKVEVHLIGFAGDLLGQELAVEFIARLRDTRAFAGPAQLAEQLKLDIDQARRLLTS
jgi:riboflavin kinase/FMN adenylyltransferase